MSSSALEETLALQFRALGVPPPKREHRFHPTRRWRFDFAWPERRLAVEVDGGTYSGGRHVRPAGFEGDCEKHNAAMIADWRVLRFTAAMIRDGRAVQQVIQLITDKL